MTLIRRSGFGDLLSLRQAMDRLFEESFVNPRTWQSGDGQMVPVDVFTSSDDVVVQAILPGVKPEEVDIHGRGQHPDDRRRHQLDDPDREGLMLQEIRRGKFVRALTLPEGLEADKATATFEDGILTLRIPKAQQVKPRQIKISTGQVEGDRQHAQPAVAGTK